jgi:hypothetical protein
LKDASARGNLNAHAPLNINHTLANMAPSVSISIALLFCGRFLSSVVELVAASKSLVLELEEKGLPESGWWSAYTDNTASSCKYWPGILLAMLIGCRKYLKIH